MNIESLLDRDTKRAYRATVEKISKVKDEIKYLKELKVSFPDFQRKCLEEIEMLRLEMVRREEDFKTAEPLLAKNTELLQALHGRVEAFKNIATLIELKNKSRKMEKEIALLEFQQRTSNVAAEKK